MKSKMTKKIILVVAIIVICASSYVLFVRNNTDTTTFRAKIVSHQTDALDAPGRYNLDNGKTVEYSCGFCPYQFEGRVIGNPGVGDTVEVKANTNFPGSDSADYYIYGRGLYIKKL